MYQHRDMLDFMRLPLRNRLWLSVLLALALIANTLPVHPATSVKAIKLASWNLEWLNRENNTGMIPRTDEDYARLARYARRLDADIVALQEVDGEGAARRVFDPTIYAFHFSADEGYLQRTGFAYKKQMTVKIFPDVSDLAIGGTRRGTDIGVELHGQHLRLLSIHLKTGCWGDSLESDTHPCNILHEQLPVLEKWIDSRAREGVPFVVVGDFNRRFSASDEFWDEIDDGDPPEADLTDMPGKRLSQCWGGEYPEYVDHIVLSRLAASWLVPCSFRQLIFDSADATYKGKLSDHCPLSIKIEVGGLK